MTVSPTATQQRHLDSTLLVANGGVHVQDLPGVSTGEPAQLDDVPAIAVGETVILLTPPLHPC